MTPARENILGRIRTALQAPAHRPLRPTSSPIWPTIKDAVENFRREFIALRGEILETPEQLQNFLKGFGKIATDESDLVTQTVGAGTANVREAELGVTGCDCVIAQTGSIAVSTRSAGGRALSVLPPTHLVIARQDQLVPDLTAAMAVWRARYDKHWPSNLCVITGPSRTADIEKILVMGAHGPKRLAIYFAG